MTNKKTNKHLEFRKTMAEEQKLEEQYTAGPIDETIVSVLQSMDR